MKFTETIGQRTACDRKVGGGLVLHVGRVGGQAQVVAQLRRSSVQALNLDLLLVIELKAVCRCENTCLCEQQYDIN